MADVSTIFRLVRPYVRNCPEAVMREWIVEAARQFCQDTRWLRENVLLNTVVDAARYQVLPSSAAEEIIGIFAADYRNMPLAPIGPQEAPSDTVGNRPYGFWYELPDILVIADAPASAELEAINVEIITRPVVGATTLSDRLVRRWERAISHGAIAMLCGMTKAGWFDPARAAASEGEYDSEMRKARSEADRNHRHFNFDTAGGIL